MEVRRSKGRSFTAEDGHTLDIHEDTRGEPYRRGVALVLHDDYREKNQLWFAFLPEREAVELRDLLNHLFPPR